MTCSKDNRDRKSATTEFEGYKEDEEAREDGLLVLRHELSDLLHCCRYRFAHFVVCELNWSFVGSVD
jgi:hypothetical protein